MATSTIKKITPADIGAIAKNEDIIKIEQGGTNGTTITQAQTNLHVLGNTYVSINSDTLVGLDETSKWNIVWSNLLKDLTPSHYMICVCDTNVSQILSNNKISGAMTIIVARSGTDNSRTFRIFAYQNTSAIHNLYNWTISDVTTTGLNSEGNIPKRDEIYSYTGTLI